MCDLEPTISRGGWSFRNSLSEFIKRKVTPSVSLKKGHCSFPKKNFKHALKHCNNNVFYVDKEDKDKVDFKEL